MLIHYGDRLENNGAELKVPSSVHLIVWKLQKFSACFLIVFCFLALWRFLSRGPILIFNLHRVKLSNEPLKIMRLYKVALILNSYYNVYIKPIELKRDWFMLNALWLWKRGL